MTASWGRKARSFIGGPEMKITDLTHLLAAIPNGLILEYCRDTVDPMWGKQFKEPLLLDADGMLALPNRGGGGGGGGSISFPHARSRILFRCPRRTFPLAGGSQPATDGRKYRVNRGKCGRTTTGTWSGRCRCAMTIDQRWERVSPGDAGSAPPRSRADNPNGTGAASGWLSAGCRRRREWQESKQYRRFAPSQRGG